jgi:RNA polymerase sigma-70 factor (sigma-E family)
MRAGGSAREAEFAEFVAARRPSMVRTATLLAAGDGHRAEDLVQTALTKLFIAWRRVEPGAREAYAQRVLVNCFLDLTRKPWWKRESSHDTLPEPHRGATEPADVGCGDTVRRALELLPPGQRAVVLLRHWLDLDVAECAGLLGVNPGTVKSQTARGLSKLRELLSEDVETEKGKR